MGREKGGKGTKGERIKYGGGEKGGVGGEEKREEGV